MEVDLNPKLKKWNDAYKCADISSAIAAKVLTDNAYLLPQAGEALDLACGRGGNALFLAKKGFVVDALDISTIVLGHLQNYIRDKHFSINCLNRDVEKEGLSDYKKYDVIVVSYFLNRDLFPQIINALKPGGLLYYQTWSQLSIDNTKGPSNPHFRLVAGELLNLCSTMRIIYYSENGLLGDIQQGTRNEALLISQKI